MSDLNMQDAVSPVDKWWLKELPPVSLLDDRIKLMAYDASQSQWECYEREPQKGSCGQYWVGKLGCVTLLFGDAIKMPELHGDDWEHSLIHVDELAEFQSGLK